ncbi:MAG: cytochrome c [Candidatus Sulfotelmatobacter sp.]
MNEGSSCWSLCLSFLATLVAVLFLSSTGVAQNRPSRSAAKPGSAPADNQSVERGKYIVEGIARCAQCHTPRDSQGVADRSKPLEGAAVWLQSAIPVVNWPLQAPRLAGVPPGSDAELIKLLTTGIWRNGQPLREPMPQFRMTEPDAQAVVAYLRSLPPQP